MARMARVLLTVASLGGVLASPAARAQASAPPPASASPTPAILPEFVQLLDDLPAPLPDSPAPAPERAWEPDLLRTLPRPPDQPRSLFQPATPLVPPPPDLERPYFELDPILDPPQWGQPGWFTDVQVGFVHPHIFGNQMNGTALTRLGRAVHVQPGVARLNWTVAPRIELGYRLGSGFGGFAISDRFFNADGSGPSSGPAGAATRSSRLDVNYTDEDYISREYTPWANWSLIWRAGLREAESFIDTRAQAPFAEAASRTGVVATRLTNQTFGMGPHFGVGLVRQFSQSGLLFITGIDIAETFTRVHQNYFATTTTSNPSGTLDRGIGINHFWQEVEILNFRVGLGWKPPSYPNVNLYLGYVYEMWWQVGTNSNFYNTFGSFNNQGVVLQLGVNF